MGIFFVKSILWIFDFVKLLAIPLKFTKPRSDCKSNLIKHSLTKVEDSLNQPQVSKLLVASNEVHANTINLDENKLRTKQEENNLKSSSIINEDKIVESETIPNATGEDKEIKKRKKKKKKKEKITFTPTFNWKIKFAVSNIIYSHYSVKNITAIKSKMFELLLYFLWNFN